MRQRIYIFLRIRFVTWLNQYNLKRRIFDFKIRSSISKIPHFHQLCNLDFSTRLYSIIVFDFDHESSPEICDIEPVVCQR